MSAGYAIAYRLGLTPWERAGEAAVEHFDRLLHREEADRARPLGRALDLGCGTGKHTVELAQRGWQAVGVDAVDRAVGKAVQRGGGPGSTQPRFVVGDVTDLTGADIGEGFDFFLDVGCFHGLDDEQRRLFGEQVTKVAAPGATMLMLCFRPGRRVALPRGASRSDTEAALSEWTVVDQEAADTSGMPGPLKRTAPQWFRLRRR